jgi:ferredoxin
MLYSADKLELNFPADTTDGRARAAALRDSRSVATKPTSLVGFQSAGNLLIIGDEERAFAAAEVLAENVPCTVLLEHRPSSELDESNGNIRVAYGKLCDLTGYLGHFSATAAVKDKEINLARVYDVGQYFDLVLDLSSPPYLQAEIPPLGYYAPGNTVQELQRSLVEIPELVGDFEKPKFFNYNPNICAHGRSGLTACTRCLDACPTDAITSLGDRVEVDPYLCQGGGTCATACPTGAMTYGYPAPSDLLEAVRNTLKHYRDAGGSRPCVLFHDGEKGAELFERVVREVPETVLPFEIEEVGSLGLDTWLSAVAYGGSHVILCAVEPVAASMLREINAQLTYAWALLEGMGYSSRRVQMVLCREPADLLAALTELAPEPELEPAGFATFDEKRRTIRLAIDHLYAQAQRAKPFVSLPAGAPFGEVWLDRERCTLCMACVSQCPAGALMDGSERPQLRFVEDNCVQCGLCARTCPEDAIGPSPRYLYDYGRRSSVRILNEEEPFNCVVCGTPFATQKLMDNMTKKLAGHWMFQSEESLRRLKMCEDCRVKDMFEREDGMAAYRESHRDH